MRFALSGFNLRRMDFLSVVWTQYTYRYNPPASMPKARILVNFEVRGLF